MNTHIANGLAMCGKACILMPSNRSNELAAAAVQGDTLAEIVRQSMDMLPDAIVVADMVQQDAPLIWVSEQFTTITGYSQSEVIGKNCRYLQGNDRLQPEIEQLRDAFRSGTGTTVTIRNYRKDGTLFWNGLTVSPRAGADGSIMYYIGLIRDVTALKENLDRVIHDAKHDRLTGLPNRYSFLDDVERIELSEGTGLLVIKLDIAGLHNVNITYGYAAGDEIIRKAAHRLRSLRPDALSRIGNTEFAVAFSLPPSSNEETILAKIASVMRSPFTIPDAIIGSRYALGYTLSIGEQPVDLLVQQAGYALHESKADPARAPRRFDETAERKSRLRGRLTTELQQAVRDGDFIYHYQPQFDLRDRRVVGVEALIRWNHPVFGLQWPDTFIGIAEDTGLIIDIEREGIRQVAAFAAKVNKGRADPLVFAVNISPLQISRGAIESLISDLFSEIDINPSWLTLELTESLLTEGSNDVIDLILRLRALGVGLAIDDFGTGYSSLRSIERFAISEIKIDRSFTQNSLISGVKRIVIETIISLGQELAVRVVAEGIETEEHKNKLQELGCLIGQGYLFSRPLPAEELRALLAAET